jgi:hypothetical protein
VTKKEEISRVIPYFASKFTLEHFRRMQFNIILEEYCEDLELGDE